MRVVIKYFLIFSLLLTGSLYSQWVQETSGIGNNSVISLAAGGNNTYAGTDSNGVYLSTDNGSTWNQTTLNNQNVLSLAASSNNTYAGTNSNGVYLSTDNGSTWNQTTLNSQNVLSLTANGNKVFAGTPVSGVYLSIDKGSTWTQTSLNNRYIYSLAIDSNNIFAGTYGWGVYISTDNGTSWTDSFNLSWEFIYSIAASGNNIFAGTSASGVYHSTNNGSTWNQTTLNSQNVLSLAIDSNNIFAGTFGTGVYLSTNNGLNWVQRNEGLPSGTTIQSLCIINNYIIAGTGNGVYRRYIPDMIGIEKISSKLPERFELYQNYPNPFNPTTKISFSIPKTSNIKLIVFDMLGNEIETLVDEQLNPGSYVFDWNAAKYASGTYFYRLTAGDFNQTKRMVLVK